MFNLWYKHGVGKNWFKNLEYSLCITLIFHQAVVFNYHLHDFSDFNILFSLHFRIPHPGFILLAVSL